MPNYTYYTTFSSGTVWDDLPDMNIYPQDDILMQQIYEAYTTSQQVEKELVEDRKNFPLFFWRETCVETCKEKK